MISNACTIASLERTQTFYALHSSAACNIHKIHKTMYGIHSDLSFHIFSLHGLTILSAIIWRSLFHTFHCTCLQFRLDRQILRWIYEQHLASNIGGLHLHPRDIQCTVGNDSVDLFFKFCVEVLQCCRGADLKWWE